MQNVHRLRPRSEMGNWGAAIAAGASALSSQKDKGGNSSSPSGGAGTPGSVSVPTTVSPTFQQSFTPQFSPNLIQSSGSAPITATTTQVAPGGQTAQGGGQAVAPQGAQPYVPSVPYIPTTQGPYSPQYQDFDARRYAIPGQDASSVIRAGQANDWVRYILPVGLSAAVILAVIGYNRRNKSTRG